MNPPDAAAAVVGTRSVSGRIAPPTLVLYVFRELLVPSLIGFALFTFFLLMHFLLQLAELIIRFEVGAADVGRLFLYNVPHIIVLTVPMAVLVGGLIAFGRMSADSEIIAMRSGGVSLYQLAVPVVLLASLATALNIYLFLEVLPWGNNAMRQLQWRLINSRTITSEVRPRVFETNFPNFTVFVEDVGGEEERWENLLLVKSDQNPPKIVMARSAEAVYDEEKRELWLLLEDGYIYEGGETAERSSVTSFETTEELLMTEGGGYRRRAHQGRAVDELRRAERPHRTTRGVRPRHHQIPGRGAQEVLHPGGLHGPRLDRLAPGDLHATPHEGHRLPGCHRRHCRLLPADSRTAKSSPRRASSRPGSECGAPTS